MRAKIEGVEGTFSFQLFQLGYIKLNEAIKWLVTQMT
jgi:hypothetical protein